MITCEPGSACSPGGGVCVITNPSSSGLVVGVSRIRTRQPSFCSVARALASSSPTRSGTAVVDWPVETFSVTLVPGGASVPALGLIPTTVPSGSGASTSRRTGVKPDSRSAAAASSNDRPITLGARSAAAPSRH